MTTKLVIFARFPEPYRSKTRLIPALGPEGAAKLGREMTRYTFAQARKLTAEFHLPAEVRFAGGDAVSMEKLFGNGFPYRPQGIGDLGQKMERAFADAFREGADRVVIIGTDCPELTPELIREAFDRLADYDLVLGPAVDGGYYLIGLRRHLPQLFTDIPWGTERVREQTLRRAEELSLRTVQLATLSDVDRPDDLAVWYRVQESTPQAALELISVIIPTLNEAEHLPSTLQSVKDASGVEVIVADGGSSDDTRRIAEQDGCRILVSPPGRARQMNAGARAARGSILLFLHADTRLPKHFQEAVRQALAEDTVSVQPPAAGAFRLRIDGPEPPLRWIEWGANLRSRKLQMPYGDQGLFVRTETFHKVGGFPDLPIMEDFELIRRLRRIGRIVILHSAVITSARRWHAIGPWRTTWIHQKMILGYYLGIPPRRLAEWYAANHRRCSRRPMRRLDSGTNRAGNFCE
ncbi:TIGR04283 family arsenosugar biosynthesis glycosyltransferase [Thermopirellula anaerolimosa]